MEKRGQLEMSFGTIFSILLIIIFIAFAFYAITKFITLQSDVKNGQFSNDLQTNVNTVWQSAQATQPETYSLPSSINKVCFINSQSGNLIMYGKNGPEQSYNINNLNISAMTQNGDSCFNVTSGQLKITLQKNFGNSLVTVTS